MLYLTNLSHNVKIAGIPLITQSLSTYLITIDSCSWLERSEASSTNIEKKKFFFIFLATNSVINCPQQLIKSFCEVFEVYLAFLLQVLRCCSNTLSPPLTLICRNSIKLPTFGWYLEGHDGHGKLNQVVFQCNNCVKYWG